LKDGEPSSIGTKAAAAKSPRSRKPAAASLEAGTFAVVADAEPKSGTAARVTAQEEQNFFNESRAAHELALGREIRDHELKKADAEGKRELERRDQEMGRLGRFFGSSWTPPMYIAAFIAVVLCIAWFATLACTQTDMADARKYLLGALMSVVSYLFGAAGARTARR
jgi:hypothetical protein